jgi:hypothetical protein
MAMGATGYNAFLFLFRVPQDSVELLQVIDEDDTDSESFESAYYPVPAPPAPPPTPKWFPLTDIDGDGLPEAKFYLFDPGHPGGVAFFELVDDRITLNLPPKIYRMFFRQELNRGGNCRTSDQYWIYGLLSKAIDAQKQIARRDCSRRAGEAAVAWVEKLHAIARKLAQGEARTHGLFMSR